jgi:hypothetical protein
MNEETGVNGGDSVQGAELASLPELWPLPIGHLNLSRWQEASGSAGIWVTSRLGKTASRGRGHCTSSLSAKRDGLQRGKRSHRSIRSWQQLSPLRRRKSGRSLASRTP